MMKKIILWVLIIALASGTFAFAQDLDFYNPVTNTRHSFNRFVDSPIIFDDISTNFDDYLIEFDKEYYQVSEVQGKLDLGARNFEEAIRDLIPIVLDEEEIKGYVFKDISGKVLYSFKSNKVYITSRRNEYFDKDPAQVLIVDITYNNISSKEDVYLNESNFRIVDSVGKIGYPYTLTQINFPQRISAGETCNAQLVYGIDNPSETIKLYFYKDIFGSATTSFTLSIE